MINPGDSFCYVEEVKNESGVWVNLSPDSLQQLNCSSVQGFALSYSAEKKEEYLVEKEVHVHGVSWVRVPPEAARKSDCLGCAVLLCLVCLFDLACFFLSSFSSLI